MAREQGQLPEVVDRGIAERRRWFSFRVALARVLALDVVAEDEEDRP